MQGARTTRTSGPKRLGQIGQQTLGARHGAGQRVADPHRHRRRRGLALFDHVEMRVEGRDLIDFGLRQLHLGGERGEMRRGDVAVFVLNQMQMLDQQVAPARAVGQQRLDIGGGLRIDLTALGRARRAPTPPSSGLVCGRPRRQFSQAHRIPLMCWPRDGAVTLTVTLVQKIPVRTELKRRTGESIVFFMIGVSDHSISFPDQSAHQKPTSFCNAKTVSSERNQVVLMRLYARGIDVGLFGLACYSDRGYRNILHQKEAPVRAVPE